MDTATPHEPLNSVHDAQQHQRLACQACQKKKIRCDRNIPCGQCLRSSLQCVASTRKVRARNPGKRTADSELRNRISKLESLVVTLSEGVGMQEEHLLRKGVPSSPPEYTNSNGPPSPTIGKYIGSPFWATLSNEVQALRDALEDEESNEETSPSPPAPSTNHNVMGDSGLLICPPDTVYVMPGALPDPSPHVFSQLNDIFLHNAEPVFKVLHRPSLMRFLNNGAYYLGLPPVCPPNKVLKAAMWFAAITTLRDEECLSRFNTPRSQLLNQYHRYVNVALAQADLINTTHLATLQGFLIYTVALRVSDVSRRCWTMTALVVRIARGIGLHRENPNDSPFLKEIKRRLWHQIRVLDTFSAADRGTELCIDANSFDTPTPSNVNDSDFDESSTTIINREEGLTDTTFNLMAHAATTLNVELFAPETSAAMGRTWQQRLDLAQDLGKQLRAKYLQFCDLSKPFDRFLYAIGNSMIAASALRAVRPIQRHVSSVPPRVDSPFVLQLAVDSLRENDAMHQDPEAGGWRWIVWVQWHALAVALAGLCSIRDTELANVAWQYVEKSYDRNSRYVADTRTGMLWRPVEKLYKKASAFRDGRTISQRNSMDASEANMSPAAGQEQPAAAPMTTYLTGPAIAAAPGPMTTAYSFTGAPSDVAFANGFVGLSPLQLGEMSWMDWERIQEDIAALNNADMASADAYANYQPSLETVQQPPPMQYDYWQQQQHLQYPYPM